MRGRRAPADGHIHATVPGGLLQDILRKLAEGSQVKIAPDVDTSERLVLRAGRARFTINTLPPVDFPDMTAGEWASGFDLPATALEQMLGRCAFAISTEETRYYLNGVYLHAVAVEGNDHADGRCDRRSPARPRAARGSGWRQRHAGRDYPAEDGRADPARPEGGGEG